MKNFCPSFIRFMTTSRWTDSALLFLRAYAGVLMVTHGWQKFQDYTMLRDTFIDPLRIGSAASLTMIIIVELGCSLLVIAGFFTRLALIPLIFSMFVAAFLTQTAFTLASAEMAMLYMGIFITLFIAGPGKYAIDNFFSLEKPCPR